MKKFKAPKIKIVKPSREAAKYLTHYMNLFGQFLNVKDGKEDILLGKCAEARYILHEYFDVPCDTIDFAETIILKKAGSDNV